MIVIFDTNITDKDEDDKLNELARKKLVEEAKRVTNLSKSVGISAAVKRPIGADKSFLTNVIGHVYRSNVSKDLKRLKINKSKTSGLDRSKPFSK